MKEINGTIPFKGFETWYQRVGENTSGKTPLLALHGGPGALHNYLKSLDGVAEKYGREVIYYDQLGCGNSPTPEDRSDLWNIETYVEEVDVVREKLGLDEIHLLGQSWGGMLALEYALRRPQGVKSIILASSLASIPFWEAEAARLVKFLPNNMQEAIDTARVTKNFDAPEFLAAADEFSHRHICELDPYPDYVAWSFDHESPVYTYMWGPQEFLATGTLRNWDLSPRLNEIAFPTLVTTGVADEATPLIAQQMSEGILGAELKIFPGTHLCHVEHADEYNSYIEEFMARHDG